MAFPPCFVVYVNAILNVKAPQKWSSQKWVDNNKTRITGRIPPTVSLEEMSAEQRLKAEEERNRRLYAGYKVAETAAKARTIINNKLNRLYIREADLLSGITPWDYLYNLRRHSLYIVGYWKRGQSNQNGEGGARSAN